MNDYEAKQAARKARFTELAAKNRSKSDSFYSSSRQISDHIPLGQPILVGHHSEGRHRRDLARIDGRMRASVEADDKAKYYEQKAAGVGSGGISSDDPEAVAKLREQLEQARREHEHMLAINKAIRKHRTAEAQIPALMALGYGEDQARKLLTPDFARRIGIPSYALTNNSANIRRIEERIKSLESSSQREDKEEEASGYTYREDVAENRVMFIFPGKPDSGIRDLLKRHAFKWSPNRGAWVRHLNGAGLYAASEVRKGLGLKLGAISPITGS